MFPTLITLGINMKLYENPIFIVNNRSHFET